MDDIHGMLQQFPNQELYVEAIFELLLEVMRQRREDDNDFLAFYEGFKASHQIPSEYLLEFHIIQEEAQRLKQLRQAKVDAYDTIIQEWNQQPDSLQLVQHVKYVDTISLETLTKVEQLASDMSFNEFITRINNQIINRLQSQGSAGIKGISWNVDIGLIYDQWVQKSLPPLTTLYHGGELGVRIGTLQIFEHDDTPMVPVGLQGRRAVDLSYPSESELAVSDRYHIRTRARLSARVGSVTDASSSSGTRRTPFDFKQVYWRTPPSQGIPIRPSPPRSKRQMDSSSDNDHQDRNGRLNPASTPAITGWIDPASLDVASLPAALDQGCDCHGIEVEEFMALVDDPFARLEDLIMATATLSGPPCAIHLPRVVSRVGLRKELRSVLWSRIQIISIRLRQGDALRNIRWSFKQHLWFEFTIAQDAQRRSRTMGAFKYMPLLDAPPSKTNPRRREDVFVTEAQQTQLEIFGYAVVSNLPTPWWLDENIIKWAHEEFAMYQYHNRFHAKRYLEVDSMVFSLTQQLLRQDPLVYLATMEMRGDGEYRLTSVPSNARYARGERVTHIFLPSSIPAGLSAEITFDEPKHHTQVRVPSPLQKETYARWTSFITSEMDKTAAIEALVDGKTIHWTTLGETGDLIFTAPHLPKRIHQSKSIHYCSITSNMLAVSANGTTLENGRSVASVIKANQSLIPMSQKDPHIPHHPFPFPAAVKLRHLSYIGDALIGDRSHDDPLVKQEREYLLSLPKAKLKTWYGNWKKTAKNALEEAQGHVRSQERAAFGEKSYFAREEQEEDVVEAFQYEKSDEEIFGANTFGDFSQMLKRRRASLVSSVNSQALTEDNEELGET